MSWVSALVAFMKLLTLLLAEYNRRKVVGETVAETLDKIEKELKDGFEARIAAAERARNEPFDPSVPDPNDRATWPEDQK